MANKISQKYWKLRLIKTQNRKLSRNSQQSAISFSLMDIWIMTKYQSSFQTPLIIKLKSNTSKNGEQIDLKLFKKLKIKVMIKLSLRARWRRFHQMTAELTHLEDQAIMEFRRMGIEIGKFLLWLTNISFILEQFKTFWWPQSFTISFKSKSKAWKQNVIFHFPNMKSNQSYFCRCVWLIRKNWRNTTKMTTSIHEIE